MSAKLFVGRLPFTFTDDQLLALFSPFGKVASAIMVPDPKNKRSRGFGFVTMVNPMEAKAAMEKLNKSLVEGKDIWVTEARPKSAGPVKMAPPEGAPAKPVIQNDAFPRPSQGESFWSPLKDAGPRSGRPRSFDRTRRDPRRGPPRFSRPAGPGSSEGPQTDGRRGFGGPRREGRPPFGGASEPRFDRRPRGEGRPSFGSRPDSRSPRGEGRPSFGSRPDSRGPRREGRSPFGSSSGPRSGFPGPKPGGFKPRGRGPSRGPRGPRSGQ